VFLPDLVVRSRRVVTPDGTRPGAVHIRGGRIVGVLDFDNVPPGCPLDDAADAVLMPGVVDTHVHVGEPGRAAWDGFEIATRAAAAGGVTTIADMPIGSIPATTTLAALESKRAAAKDNCFVDVGFWGGSVPGNAHDLASLFEAGVLGFACVLGASASAEFPPLSEADLQIVMPALTRIGATLLVHAELPGPVEETAAASRPRRWIERIARTRRASSRRYVTYLESRPKGVENDAIALLIQRCRAHLTRTHVGQLSSSDALAPLFHARAARLPITAETCPHYLYFVAEEVSDGATAFKCRPPIRERENREFLWAALAGGLIQMVVSDHSAVPAAMKHLDSGDFLKAWSGIPSLQLSLSVTWTGARDRGYTLDQVAAWMARAPAQLVGLSRKGRIDVGYDADLVVFHPDTEFTVGADLLHARHAVTPYLGRRLYGVVERTYLRGTQIFGRGQAEGLRPHGRLLARQ
jgi:allantoinase